MINQQRAPLGLQLLAVTGPTVRVAGKHVGLVLLPHVGTRITASSRVLPSSNATDADTVWWHRADRSLPACIARRVYAARSRSSGRPGAFNCAIETKPKTARFIDHMHGVTRPSSSSTHGTNSTAPDDAPAWAKVIVLRHRHVDPGVHIQTDLDHRPAKFYLVNGNLE